MEVQGTGAAGLRAVSIAGKGRGIVAERAMRAGEIIERAPVLIVPEAQRAALDSTSVGNYIFMWEHDSVAEDLYAGTGRAAIVLGFSSLLNHSDSANCDFVRYIDAYALDLFALRDISAGEELTINYGLKLWFPTG